MGYQPTLGTELAELEERISSSASGSITSVQAVYVPADDMTDASATHPLPTSLRSPCFPGKGQAGDSILRSIP